MGPSHLTLRRVGGSALAPAPARPPFRKARRSADRFCRDQLKRLDEMRKSYERDRRAYAPHASPSLVFRVDLLRGAEDDEDELRSSLEGAGITTISSALNGGRRWVVLADDPGLAEFRQRLEEYRTDEKPSFVDRIRAVGEMNPDEKVGSPPPVPLAGDGGPGYADVEAWRLDDERMRSFAGGLRAMLRARGGRVADEITTNDYYLARVYCDGRTLREVARLREVASIERPPVVRGMARPVRAARGSPAADLGAGVRPLPGDAAGAGGQARRAAGTRRPAAGASSLRGGIGPSRQAGSKAEKVAA